MATALLPVLLMAGGGALAVWGARAATVAERPVDLVAALAAAAGVLLAGVGGAASVAPGFLG